MVATGHILLQGYSTVQCTNCAKVQSLTGRTGCLPHSLIIEWLASGYGFFSMSHNERGWWSDYMQHRLRAKPSFMY